MATEQEYWNRLRRAAIACLSTSLRHGSPAMLDSLCELERAVYDGMTEPVAPDPGLREAIAEVMFQHTTAFTGERGPCYLDEFVLVADAVLAVLAERGVR